MRREGWDYPAPLKASLLANILLTIMFMLGIVLLVLVMAAGCSSNPYAIDNYSDVTHYDIHYDRQTAEGISVNGDLNLVTIDRLTDEVEACLASLYPKGELPADVIRASSCIVSKYNPFIHREWIGVKLAPDWFKGCYAEDYSYVGPGNGEEIFHVLPDEQQSIDRLCMDKGFVPTPICPCGVRAIIQGNSTIITAPNLHMYKAEIIRLISGCNNIWTSALASCYTKD